jgi:flagellar biosynthesis protein FlhF
MQVRTFQASQIREALSIVKREMGADAVILSTRKLRRGLGLLGGAGIEVTAAVDEHARAAALPAAPAERVDPDTDRQLGTLRREIRVLREQLRETSDLAANLTAQLPTPGTEWRRILEQADVDPALASEIVRAALAASDGDEAAARPAVVAEIVRHLPTAAAGDPEPRVIAVAGPTGAGKTTTLAKIAARAAIRDDRRVALLTLDTHRVGAVAQLGRYAELIGVPFEAIRDPADLSQAVGRHAGADLVMIDTAGRAEPRADAETLASCLRAVPGAESYLAVPAATRRTDLRAVVRRFAALRATRLIVTKTDETALLGGVLNAAAYSGLPLAWLCGGPRVPEDLEAADALALAHRILDMEAN